MTAHALTVVEKFVNNDELSHLDEVLAEEVLVAANFLQMDVLQDNVLEEVRKLINNANCVDHYDQYCDRRGINKLKAPIMSTVILPAEMARRKKYGKPDLVIKLQQLEYKCHKTVLASASKKIKGILNQDSSIKTIEGKALGLTQQNVQMAYNCLEQIYLNEEFFRSSSMKESLKVLELISLLELSEQFYQSTVESLCRQVSVSNVGELYDAGVEMGQEDVVNIALHYLTFKIQDLALESLFLALPLHHVRKVLASSRLNVPDELTVGKMALKWMEAQQKVKLTRNAGNLK